MEERIFNNNEGYICKMKITKKQFKSYVDVQKSGITNMWNIKLVCDISGLKEEEAFFIMKNYKELNEEFNLK